MIYVIQSNNYSESYKVVYAGSSAHEALLAASQMEICRITAFKGGERYIVTEANQQRQAGKDGGE